MRIGAWLTGIYLIAGGVRAKDEMLIGRRLEIVRYGLREGRNEEDGGEGWSCEDLGEQGKSATGYGECVRIPAGEQAHVHGSEEEMRCAARELRASAKRTGLHTMGIAY